MFCYLDMILFWAGVVVDLISIATLTYKQSNY